jgi:hypothetical protein
MCARHMQAHDQPEVEAAKTLNRCGLLIVAGCGLLGNFVIYKPPVLGSVLGCLSTCIEVPDIGALRHETAARMVEIYSY